MKYYIRNYEKNEDCSSKWKQLSLVKSSITKFIEKLFKVLDFPMVCLYNSINLRKVINDEQKER